MGRKATRFIVGKPTKARYNKPYCEVCGCKKCSICGRYFSIDNDAFRKNGNLLDSRCHECYRGYMKDVMREKRARNDV